MSGKVVFLVAESDRALSNEVSNLLKEAFSGAVVYTATEGGEALKKLKNAPPGVLIAGMELGSKVPFAELMRSIEADRTVSKIPICVLSDITDCEPKLAGDISSGRIKFLSMPLQPAELVTTVKAMLQAESMANNTFRTMLLRPGEPLFREGEKANCAYLVKRGKLKASRGTNVELGEILPGEFVGEMAHITGEARSANVTAIDETELIEIPLGTLDLLVFSKPTWTKALLKTLCRRLRDANLKRA